MELKNFLKILETCIIFLVGFLSSYFINFFLNNVEIPFASDLTKFSFSFTNPEAPSDFIKEELIDVYKDRVVIWVKEPSLSYYAPTGSMKPVFDKGANGIRIKVKNPDDIKVGDIISFRRNNQLIVHRVIEKGKDSKGVYFVTKGDNNSLSDGKIRFEDIEYKTVAVIW